MSKKITLRTFLLRWWHIGFVSIVFLVPYAIIYGTGLPAYISRSISTGIYYTIVPIWLIWWSWDPDVKRIPDSAKLSQPGYEKSKSISEKVIGVLFTIGALIIFWFTTVSFMQDTYNLHLTKTATKVQGITESQHSFMGTSSFRQTISFHDNNGTEHKYTLMYSLTRIEIGSCVQLLVLPKSNLVIAILKNAPQNVDCTYKVTKSQI